MKVNFYRCGDVCRPEQEQISDRRFRVKAKCPRESKEKLGKGCVLILFQFTGVRVRSGIHCRDAIHDAGNQHVYFFAFFFAFNTGSLAKGRLMDLPVSAAL